MAHNQLSLNMDLIRQAEDQDNWRGVVNLAPKVIRMWTQLKELADAQLED
jgi:hypothetical protein